MNERDLLVRWLEERRSAAAIQRALLPSHLPRIAGFSLAAQFLPAEDLSGDIYDAFALDEHRIGLYVADVSGHGIGPALITVFLHEVVDELRVECRRDVLYRPSATLAVVHERFVALRVGDHYVTMIYAVLDTAARTLVFSSAGHPLPLVLQGDKVIEARNCNGAIFSPWVDPGTGWPEQTLHLPRGSRGVFYTDGLTDSHILSGAAEPPSPLPQHLLEGKGLGGDDWARQTFDAFRVNYGPTGPRDDMTLLAISSEFGMV